MMTIKPALLAASLFLLSLPAFSQLFNENLSDSERDLLEQGSIVIRYINDTEKTCICKDVSPAIEKVRAMMENLEPNYLCEVLYQVPYEGNEDFLEQVRAIFNDSTHYLKIIYQPEGTHSSAPLFSQSILDETIPLESGNWKETEGTEFRAEAGPTAEQQPVPKSEIEAATHTEAYPRANVESLSRPHTALLMKMRFQMDPFRLYHANMILETDGENFSFTHTNLDTLTYLGIPVIKPNRMLAGLAVTKMENRWLVYASGGLNAWKPFFLKTTLENMFNNRMKDFSVFYINQVQVH